MTDSLIPPHGGYRDLKSYQMAEIVHDATVVFCDRFIDKRSRTHDQMVQAALKLVGVARASLEELNYLLDQQLHALEKGFLEEGGFTERLYRVRSQTRGTWKKL